MSSPAYWAGMKSGRSSSTKFSTMKTVLAALIVVRGMFWSKKKGGLSPEDLIAATGQGHLQSPALPEWVEAWRQTLDALSAQAKKDREIQRELPRES